jgi:hypothetical protein
MHKKIKFIPTNKYIHDTENPVSPASKSIAEWFKKIPAEEHGSQRLGRDKGTVKKCLPYIDALTFGYTWSLPFDIEVSNTGSGKYFRWQVENRENFIHMEPEYRTIGMQAPEGFDPEIWRFISFPMIETPPGYSILLTHPINRYDLPFLVISGVIDTDKLHQESSVPFYLRKDFEGILDKGTPIAQIIPFKRDKWEHEYTEPYSDSVLNKLNFEVRSIINRSYSKQYWTKKEYR